MLNYSVVVHRADGIPVCLFRTSTEADAETLALAEVDRMRAECGWIVNSDLNGFCEWPIWTAKMQYMGYLSVE